MLQGILPDEPEQLLLHIEHTEPVLSSDHDAIAIPAPISQLIEEFSDLFQPPTSLPLSRACKHEIPLLSGAQPVFIWPYRYPPKLKDEIEAQVQEMLSQGLIQPSSSSFSSSVLLIKKKDGSYRFCVDFRHLNALTKKSKFPVPVFDQLMDELAHAKWFSTLDLRAGFHQILLHPGEEFKTAFQTHLGQYEFRVMAFGLTGTPGTFQGAMNGTLALLVFFDDILVYSPTFEAHVDHLRQVFQWLRADQWKLKLSKCTFARESISYLGHIISSEGLSTNPAKVQAVLKWLVPSSVREL